MGEQRHLHSQKERVGWTVQLEEWVKMEEAWLVKEVVILHHLRRNRLSFRDQRQSCATFGKLKKIILTEI